MKDERNCEEFLNEVNYLLLPVQFLHCLLEQFVSCLLTYKRHFLLTGMLHTRWVVNWRIASLILFSLIHYVLSIINCFSSELLQIFLNHFFIYHIFFLEQQLLLTSVPHGLTIKLMQK